MSALRNPLAGILPDLFKRDADDKRLNVETSTPGSLRFDGLLAGLFGRTGSGDRSDAANYVLFCPSCGSALGTLAKWRPWKDGTRAVRCIGTLGQEGKVCDVVTVLNGMGKILRVAPGAAYDDWMRGVVLKQAETRAKELEENAARAIRDETGERW